MTEFILLGNVGLIALPECVTEEEFNKYMFNTCIYNNYYDYGW